MSVNNGRAVKKSLREKYINMRNSILPEDKQRLDEAVFERVVRLTQYKECKLLLTYVSKGTEVDTRRLIDYALGDNKTVAVPRCVENTRDMEFYIITSPDQLEPGCFSVLEPKIAECKKAEDFSDSFCIVPGLSFDVSGYRLGYGMGYYDRFLSSYQGRTAGLCYSEFVRFKELPKNRYDKSVELIVTEGYIRRTVR